MFSIITPVFNAESTIQRTILSVVNQTIDDWEYIVVNDGSTDKTQEILEKFLTRMPGKFRLIKHDLPKQRAIARNTGMKAASGDWICWLDADDMYLPYYLEAVQSAIAKYPDKKIFNFGGVIMWPNYSMTVRMSREHYKGELFKSGDVMSGGFVFKKELLTELSYLPEYSNPYDFGKAMKSRVPEIAQMYPTQDDLGNPWGDDWSMYYMLTRTNDPQWLNIAPYVVNIRAPQGRSV